MRDFGGSADTCRTPRVQRYVFSTHCIAGRVEELDDGRVTRALGTGSFGNEAHSATRTGDRLPCCKNLEERERERKRHPESRWIPREGVEIRGRPGNGVFFRGEQPIEIGDRESRLQPISGRNAFVPVLIVDESIQVTSAGQGLVPQLTGDSRSWPACRDRRRERLPAWQPARGLVVASSCRACST